MVKVGWVKVTCKGRCGHRFYNDVDLDGFEKMKDGKLSKKGWMSSCPKCGGVTADIIIKETKEKVIFT